jgi:hypothetical protein
MLAPVVKKGGYTFKEAKIATTFARATFYHWEKEGFIPPLLRIGGKTLVPAEVIERLLSGELKLPSGHRARHLHAPPNESTPNEPTPPHRKRGRPRKPGPTETG